MDREDANEAKLRLLPSRPCRNLYDVYLCIRDYMYVRNIVSNLQQMNKEKIY